MNLVIVCLLQISLLLVIYICIVKAEHIAVEPEWQPGAACPRPTRVCLRDCSRQETVAEICLAGVDTGVLEYMVNILI